MIVLDFLQQKPEHAKLRAKSNEQRDAVQKKEAETEPKVTFIQDLRNHIQIHYYGISNRVKTCPFAATYKLAWTSCVPKRGKTGLEVLGDIKPKREEDAKEKLEIIPVTDILMSGISLEKGKLSASCSLQLKRKLFALRYQSVILNYLNFTKLFMLSTKL